MTQRFWRVQAPEYESDSEDRLANGTFDRAYGMPGIRCEACGQTWAESRILPFPCPRSMRDDPELITPRPVSSRVHRELREKVLAQLQREGLALDRTADQIHGDFMGGSLRVPRSGADFLWCAMGSLIVSPRVRDVFLDHAPGAVVAGPVTSEYFEVIPQRESARPPGSEITRTCGECGRQEYDHERRQLVMRPEMWTGDPVFLLATTLWVVVTDPMREALQKIDATNVKFSGLTG